MCTCPHYIRTDFIIVFLIHKISRVLFAKGNVKKTSTAHTELDAT